MVKRRLIAATALAVLLLPAAEGEAHAFKSPGGHGKGGSSGTTNAGQTQPNGGASGTSSPAGSYGSTVQRTVGNCHVVSGPSFLGLDCGSFKGGDTVTIKGILGTDPVPGCWDARMTPEQEQAMGVQSTPGPDGSSWYWHKCLKGIDPKTFQVQPGGVSFTYGVAAYPNEPKPGQPGPVTLTPAQQRLVAGQEKNGLIPAPVAGLAPDATPVVNQETAFFDGTPGEVRVSAGPVILRGLVDNISVRPTGSGDVVECKGTGVRVVAGDTRASKPDACWYKYAQSSAGQLDDRYQASMTAKWTVSISADGGKTWQPLNSFDKTATTTVAVNEIQSVVVR